MAVLDLNTDRPSHAVVLPDGKQYRIPVDFTVGELERILENNVELEKLAAEEAADDGGRQQLRRFWELVFRQVAILFERFHPEVTDEYLRGILTEKEALDIIGFQRVGEGTASEPKKKLQPSASLKTSGAPSPTSSSPDSP